MKRPLLVFFICELAYLAVARTFTHTYGGGEVSKELWWSGIRGVSFFVMLWLFRETRRPQVGETNKITPASLLGAGMFLAPVLAGNEAMGSPLNYVFAATSLVVGLREELAYRAILQTQLRRRFGVLPALLISNVLFVFYHLGAQAFTPLNIWQMFAAGTIIGLAYEASGSLLLAVALHAIYDAIYCFTPLLHPPLPEIAGSAVLAVTMLALLMARRKNLFNSTSSSP
jgi:membrane protease YdiL (CAAX protease family)